MNLPLRGRDLLFASSLAVVAFACGSAKNPENSSGVTMASRPTGIDAGSSPRPNSCFEGDDCKSAESCVATCGVHQLGDSNCACQQGTIVCTSCALDPAFRGMIQDAKELCAPEVEFGLSCSTKGATCIQIVGQMRSPCLCWKGKSGLEWDCDDGDPVVSTPALFQDLAPPTPPQDGPKPPRNVDAAAGTVGPPVVDASTAS